MEHQQKYGQDNLVRLRRSWSWIERSREVNEGSEEEFLFLWIAFNAAYGRRLLDVEEIMGERQIHEEFLGTVIDKDEGGRIKNFLMEIMSGPVRVLLNNQYVFEPFWKSLQDSKEEDWKWKQKQRNRRVFKGWGKNNVKDAFREILARLYTLRNQMVHGGRTRGQKSVGGDQLRDGCMIMRKLVPLIVEIMSKDIEKDRDTDKWGAIAYPLINFHIEHESTRDGGTLSLIDKRTGEMRLSPRYFTITEC